MQLKLNKLLVISHSLIYEKTLQDNNILPILYEYTPIVFFKIYTKSS